MAWPLIIMGAVALGTSIYKGIQANKQKKELQKQSDALGTYEKNPLADQMFAQAQSLYGGRMAGATAAEQGIYTNRANTLASLERNATDSSQLLATAGQTQAMSDLSVNQLGQMEAGDKANRFGLLQQSAAAVYNENDKEWADKIRRMQQNMAIYGVYSQNMTNAVSDGANGIASAAAGAYGGGSTGLGKTSLATSYGNSVWSNAIKNPYN